MADIKLTGLASNTERQLFMPFDVNHHSSCFKQQVKPTLPSRTYKQGFVALLLITLMAPLSTTQELLDKVAVIVNNDVVLYSEILGAADGFLNEGVSLRDLPAEDWQQLAEVSKDRSIVENLLLQEAKNRGIFVSDQELHRAMETVAADKQQTLTQLQQELIGKGKSFYDFQKTISNQLLIQKYQSALVQSRLHISEEEVEQFLNSRESESINDLEYLLNYIVLRVDNDNPQSAMQMNELAQSIVQQLKSKTATIEELARKHSVAKNAQSGGASQWRPLASVLSVFSPSVRWAIVGDILGPIIDNNRIFIAQVTDIRGPSHTLEQEYDIAHIMLEVTVTRTEEQARIQLQDLRNKILNEQEDFSELALGYSDDPGTKHLGGKLGKVLASQLPPEFLIAVQSLDTSEVSEPFATSEGIHIARLVGQTTVDRTVDNLRTLAINTIYRQRYAEELDRLINNLREDTYIQDLTKHH